MAQKSYKILIVDDDKKFLALVSGMLHAIDDSIVIETARSGPEGLKKVKHAAPDLVLLDIGMHNMNGLVTLRFIKSIDKSTPVYFLSGHPKDIVQEAVGMVPADGYFTKTEFVELLRNDGPLDTILNAGKVGP